MKAVDIVLIPDEPLYSSCIELSQQVEHGYLLRGAVPHITLAMTVATDEDIVEICNRLRALVHRHSIVLLQNCTVRSVGSDHKRYAVIEVDRTEALQRLHLDVLETMRDLLDYTAEPHMFDQECWDKPLSDYWASGKVYSKTKDCYWPHITLGKGSMKSVLTELTNGTASTLALYHLGKGNTCVTELASFRL